MKTLIIYDNEGYIIQQITGNYRVPIGIHYLEVEESTYTGKMIKSVNVETKELVLEDIPLSEIELSNQRISELENALIELASLIGGTV